MHNFAAVKIVKPPGDVSALKAMLLVSLEDELENCTYTGAAVERAVHFYVFHYGDAGVVKGEQRKWLVGNGVQPVY